MRCLSHELCGSSRDQHNIILVAPHKPLKLYAIADTELSKSSLPFLSHQTYFSQSMLFMAKKFSVSLFAKVAICAWSLEFSSISKDDQLFVLQKHRHVHDRGAK